MSLREFPRLLKKSASVRMLTTNSVKTVPESAIPVLNRGSETECRGFSLTCSLRASKSLCQ
jgi:hypothetical protein